MQKSVRNIAFIAVFALASTPAMLANPTGTNPRPQGSVMLVNPTGTNPRPQGSVVTASDSFTSFVQAVLRFFGA